jgi:hypothetical protein
MVGFRGRQVDEQEDRLAVSVGVTSVCELCGLMRWLSTT